MRSRGNFREKVFLLEWIAACVLLVGLSEGRSAAKVPSFARNIIFSEPKNSVPGPEKNFTGIRVRPDSILVLYYHEQTIAVVEVVPRKALFNCELLEVRTKVDQEEALKSLKSVVVSQTEVAFTDMIELMGECQRLDPPLMGGRVGSGTGRGEGQERPPVASGVRGSSRQISSLFSGVFPGTKWCGVGDIASSYHDLGSDKELDKCCRTHDLCPVKVMGLKTQYNLTNYSLYTKSHCICDDLFYDCLKAVGTTTSNILGGIYFNLAPVTCVEDIPHEDLMSFAKKHFSIKNKRF